MPFGLAPQDTLSISDGMGIAQLPLFHGNEDADAIVEGKEACHGSR